MSTRAMKMSEIFEEAALLTANQSLRVGCCYSIDRIEGLGYLSETQNYFADWFMPPDKSRGDIWWSWHVKKPRILALCFAAAIARSEGL